MAQALSAGLAANNLGALNTFASNDAALHRNNIRNLQGLAGGMQNQRNLIDQNKIANYNAKLHAYGAAMQRGLQNMASASSTALSSYSGSLGNSSNAFSNSGMSQDYGQNDYAPSSAMGQSASGSYDPTEKDFQQGGEFGGGGSSEGLKKFWSNLYQQGGY